MTERQARKRPSLERRFVVITAIAVAYAMTLLPSWVDASGPESPLDEWEDSQVLWQQGECSECHQDKEDDEAQVRFIAGARPASHESACWTAMHGRADASSPQRCFVCHSAATCESCHSHPPATHTSRFMNPSSDGLDANRHVMLARLRPSSCLVCHESFVSTCGQCHAPGEVQDWQKRAVAGLKHWPELVAPPLRDLPQTGSE